MRRDKEMIVYLLISLSVFACMRTAETEKLERPLTKEEEAMKNAMMNKTELRWSGGNNASFGTLCELLKRNAIPTKTLVASGKH